MDLQKEERHCPSHYIQNPHSMLQLSYNCAFMVARKPPRKKSALQLKHSTISATTKPSSSLDGDNFKSDSNPSDGASTTLLKTYDNADLVKRSDSFMNKLNSCSVTHHSIENNLNSDDVFS